MRGIITEREVRQKRYREKYIRETVKLVKQKGWKNSERQSGKVREI